MLTVKEMMTLDFERRRFKYIALKEDAIRDTFSERSTFYYQRLDALLDRPEALVYNAQLVRRLQRLREARRQLRGVA